MDILYSVLFMKSEGAIKFLTSGKQATSLSVLSSPQRLSKNLSLVLHKAREPVYLVFISTQHSCRTRLCPRPTLLTHPHTRHLHHCAPATVASRLLLNTAICTSGPSCPGFSGLKFRLLQGLDKILPSQ